MNKVDEKAAELVALRAELEQVEAAATTYTLADAIREGCQVTEQAFSWGDGATACAMSSAVIAAKSRGLL